ncbi:amidohydrolase [Tropicibacter sp. R16_0]|uniref:amidohydrolase n=1 Tax=Tropicibacter sp. R16_0 TaxID=2821102 RepID=UPI001ADBBD3C|nr:amidohydrolase [Tropicibacter sp. R16_0]MBO9452817.1 amidohydrolase [Tropicibacter sp. R16_0]
MPNVTVFRAKKIITMDRNCPQATHVAVRDGIIVGVGGAECGDGWGTVTRDDRFADHVIMPGLIEAHAHVSAGGVWRFTYCGHYLRQDPDGKDWPGVTDEDALIARLRDIAARTPEGEPVVGWGFDPGFVSGRRLDRDHLDQVSDKHPVAVHHSNGHVLTANSMAMDRAGIGRDSNIEGILRGQDGEPVGELHEFAAMGPVMKVVGLGMGVLSDAEGVRAYGKVARNCGVTTVADLFSDLHDDEVTMLERVTGEAAFPARYVPIMNAMVDAPEREAERAVALRSRSTEKLHLGYAKLFTDGSIQAGTAKLKSPGYYGMEDHGIWNMEVDHFRATVKALHEAGVKTHIHTNGDAASELAINAIADAMLESPNPDLRHTLEHVQLATMDQFKRMKSLGITVNLFGNHLYYFGDIHWTKSVGPERASRMNACADAWSVFGGDFAIHSDAPVTPMGPLTTAWCAVNRVTEQGRTLGNSQQISVAQALHCITLGAAYVLKMDAQVGSIQVGKRADFAVLDRDPTTVDPMALRDVQVLGTVLGGVSTT